MALGQSPEKECLCCEWDDSTVNEPASLLANSPIVSAYLDRLGLVREAPSVDALRRLHRAHVERIAYETLWIHLGEGWNIDPTESTLRIATQRRGGYCFHLNGAFHELLLALGYESFRHVGTVHGPEGPTVATHANHLALTVHNVPSDEGPSDWYVDAGLGDALHEPMALRAGSSTQGPMSLELIDLGPLVWQLRHDLQFGSFTAMTFAAEPTSIDAFAGKHVELSTSPESRFKRTITVQRRDAHGADVLRGLVLKRIGDEPRTTELLQADEWFSVLSEVFDLPLTHVSNAAKRDLWASVSATHARWQHGS